MMKFPYCRLQPFQSVRWDIVCAHRKPSIRHPFTRQLIPMAWDNVWLALRAIREGHEVIKTLHDLNDSLG